MQKIRFLPLLCVVLMLFTAPTLLAQQEPDTPYSGGNHALCPHDAARRT